MGKKMYIRGFKGSSKAFMYEYVTLVWRPLHTLKLYSKLWIVDIQTKKNQWPAYKHHAYSADIVCRILDICTMNILYIVQCKIM